MAEYGTYSGINCVLAEYKGGKLVRIIENVNPETVFFNQRYCRNGYHYMEFDYTENGRELKGQIRVDGTTSFGIYPDWMTDHFKKVLVTQEEYGI